MPFKSQAQRGWMYANHPKMAKEWEVETPDEKLSQKKKKKKERKGIGGSVMTDGHPGM